MSGIGKLKVTTRERSLREERARRFYEEAKRSKPAQTKVFAHRGAEGSVKHNRESAYQKFFNRLLASGRPFNAVQVLGYEKLFGNPYRGPRTADAATVGLIAGELGASSTKPESMPVAYSAVLSHPPSLPSPSAPSSGASSKAGPGPSGSPTEEAVSPEEEGWALLPPRRRAKLRYKLGGDAWPGAGASTGAGAGAGASRSSGGGTAAGSSAAASSSSGSAGAKRRRALIIKALQDRLERVASIEARLASGLVLDDEQQEVLASRTSVVRALERLGAPLYRRSKSAHRKREQAAAGLESELRVPAGWAYRGGGAGAGSGRAPGGGGKRKGTRSSIDSKKWRGGEGDGGAGSWRAVAAGAGAGPGAFGRPGVATPKGHASKSKSRSSSGKRSKSPRSGSSKGKKRRID